MIDLMIKNIFDNNNKIDAVIKCIKKTDSRNRFAYFLIAFNLYLVSKAVKNQEERIKELEISLEEMKSKGE